MPTVRTFIAVESSGTVASRAMALAERLRAADAKVSWVRPENMHWTLKFLGDVELTRTADICRAVIEAAAGFVPISVEVRGAGAFPDTARPRTIWLGMGEGSDRVVELAGAVEDALAEVGFPRERRKFSPHLTIGRVRGPRNTGELGELLKKKADYEAGVMEIDEVLILSSTLERDGPVYEVLGRAPLGSA